MALNIVLGLILVVCFAMLFNEGFWSNTLTLINALFASLLAMSYFEPLADFLESKQESYTYVLDFLSMWFIFFLAFALMRAITDELAKKSFAFENAILEQAGKSVMALAVGWLMISFTLTTLHTAPLARTAFKGGFQAEPMSNNFLGMAPDRMWLGFVQHRSKNALSGSEVFDPNAEFIFKYGSRREKFSTLESIRVDKTQVF